MKRWSTSKHDEIESPVIDRFLEDIIDVYRKHGLSLAHEDSHGGFLVETHTLKNVEWLMAAADNTGDQG